MSYRFSDAASSPSGPSIRRKRNHVATIRTIAGLFPHFGRNRQPVTGSIIDAEVRNVEGRLHVARKPRHHDEWDPYVPPYDPYGPGVRA